MEIISKTSRMTDLLSLPDELWIKIGKFAIDLEPDFRLASCWQGHQWQRACKPPIADVCRSFRFELLPYYLKTKLARHMPTLYLGYHGGLDVEGDWLVHGIAPDMRKHIGEVAAFPSVDVAGFKKWTGLEFVVREGRSASDSEIVMWFLTFV